MAIDSDARRIDEGQRGEVVDSRQLILKLELAEPSVGGLLEGAAAPRRTAVVELEDDHAAIGEVLPHEVSRPLVLDRLPVRSAVHHDDHRVALARAPSAAGARESRRADRRSARAP